jgi:ADP-ribosylglycohydrolase
MEDILLSKFKGTVIGAALGDAMGKAVEEVPAKDVYEYYGKPITGFVKPHPSSPSDFLLPHEVSAETELLKLTLESIVEAKTFDPYYFLQKLILWIKEHKVHKYLEPTILNIAKALEEGITPEEIGIIKTSSIDNILHTIAIALYHYDHPTLAAEGARILALVTGRGEDLEDGAQILGAATSLLVAGEDYDFSEENDKFKFLKDIVDYCPELKKAPKYIEKVEEALKENLKLEEAILRFGNGSYIWEALPLSLYIFLKDVNYPQRAFLNAINSYGEFGGDTDAIGFLVGGWIGAYWGIEVFPPEWVEKVQYSKELQELAEKLYEIVTY